MLKMQQMFVYMSVPKYSYAAETAIVKVNIYKTASVVHSRFRTIRNTKRKATRLMVSIWVRRWWKCVYVYHPQPSAVDTIQHEREIMAHSVWVKSQFSQK